jgi:hypothetical protein
MACQQPRDERPYLQVAIADFHEAWFRPMGFQLRIVSNSPAVIEAAEASFGLFGSAVPSDAPDLVFRLYEHEIDDGAPGNPLFRIEGPLVYQTTGRDSVLVADRERGLTYGYFSRTTLEDLPFFRWHFLDLALFFILEWRGFLGIHGAAICKNGRALLLRGPSGQGKSTLTYAGARDRFQALAEDVVWIGSSNDLWWGIPSSFHLLPDAKELFPELRSHRALVQLNGKRKIPVDLRRVRPGSVVTSGRPGPIVMMRRIPGRACRLEKLALDDAFGEWLSGCATKEREATDYERRVSSLLRCGAYRLHLGDDIEQALDLLEPLFD